MANELTELTAGKIYIIDFETAEAGAFLSGGSISIKIIYTNSQKINQTDSLLPIEQVNTLNFIVPESILELNHIEYATTADQTLKSLNAVTTIAIIPQTTITASTDGNKLIALATLYVPGVAVQIGPKPGSGYDVTDPAYAPIQQSVRVGGFYVDDNSFVGGKEWNAAGYATKTWGDPDTVLVCTGTSQAKSIAGSPVSDGWCFTAGNNFGVNKKGEIYATAGKIGDFEINNRSSDPSKTDYLLYNVSDQGGILMGTNITMPDIGAGIATGAYSATETAAGYVTLSTSDLKPTWYWQMKKAGGMYTRYADGTARNNMSITLDGGSIHGESVFKRITSARYSTNKKEVGGWDIKGAISDATTYDRPTGQISPAIYLQSYAYKELEVGDDEFITTNIECTGPGICLPAGNNIVAGFVGSTNYPIYEIHNIRQRLGGRALTDYNVILNEDTDKVLSTELNDKVQFIDPETLRAITNTYINSFSNNKLNAEVDGNINNYLYDSIIELNGHCYGKWMIENGGDTDYLYTNVLIINNDLFLAPTVTVSKLINVKLYNTSPSISESHDDTAIDFNNGILHVVHKNQDNTYRHDLYEYNAPVQYNNIVYGQWLLTSINGETVNETVYGIFNVIGFTDTLYLATTYRTVVASEPIYNYYLPKLQIYNEYANPNPSDDSYIGWSHLSDPIGWGDKEVVYALQNESDISNAIEGLPFTSITSITVTLNSRATLTTSTLTNISTGAGRMRRRAGLRHVSFIEPVSSGGQLPITNITASFSNVSDPDGEGLGATITFTNLANSTQTQTFIIYGY